MLADRRGLPCRSRARCIGPCTQAEFALGCSHAGMYASVCCKAHVGRSREKRRTEAPLWPQRAARRAGRTRCCRTPSQTARWSPCRRARCCSAAVTSTASRSSSPPCVCPVREAERREPTFTNSGGAGRALRGPGCLPAAGSEATCGARQWRGFMQCAVPSIAVRSLQSLGGW